MTLTPVGAITDVLTFHLTGTETLEKVEASEELWYRDNDSDGYWNRIDTYRQAEDLIRARNSRSPWVTIRRIVDTGFDDEHYRVHAIEVLGWADAVYVCGDVTGIGWQWRWSSWPIGAPGGPLTPTVVGPSWYRGGVWKEQLQTVNDAVAQLWPATHAVHHVAHQAPGYVWLPRERDCVPNHHLRVPDDD